MAVLSRHNEFCAAVTCTQLRVDTSQKEVPDNLNESFLTLLSKNTSVLLSKTGICHNKWLFCRNVIIFSERFLTDWLALQGNIKILLYWTEIFCETYLLTNLLTCLLRSTVMKKQKFCSWAPSWMKDCFSLPSSYLQCILYHVNMLLYQ